MNTAIRVGAHNRFQSTLPLLQVKHPRLVNLLLIVSLLISAFAVLYTKDLNRRLFIHYQSLQIAHEKFYEEWEKLLLEQSTWSTQARVQKIAQSRLGMSTPTPNEVVILRVHK